MVGFDNVAGRLSFLMEHKRVSPADMNRDLGFDFPKISRLMKGDVKTLRGKTAQILASYFGCSREWIATGKGSPFHASQATGNVADFQSRKIEMDRKNELDALSRLRFKTQCGAVYFDEFFDFIADEYGENKEGADKFLQWFQDNHASYRFWLAEKKQRAENTEDASPGYKSACND